MADNKDIKIKEECLAISIDIRNSTQLYEKYGIKKAAEIIAEFMDKCYVIMTKDNNFFSNIIYAGDGMIGVAYADDNKQAFDKMFEISLDLKKVILEYKDDFEAGIGMAYGETAIIKVKNLRKDKNNTLYTGYSVAPAAKLCKLMPFQHIELDEKSYIALSKEFYKKLSEANQDKCYKTKTKYIEN